MPFTEPSFADAVIGRVRELGHPLCVGLDPHPERIPALFREPSAGAASKPPAATSEVVERFLLAVLDRVAGRVAVVKPQAAFFERWGWRGHRVLEKIVEAARERDLLVLLDAKRGDIGSTAAAYAASYLGPAAPCRADALTLNPYLGLDSLAPFLDEARRGAGLFVLVRTSNPGAADFQDLESVGEPLYLRVARSLAGPASELVGESGFSSLGAVVGATWPGEAERVREILPHSLFLVPGYGAQGGSAAQAVAGFVRQRDGSLVGGLVNSSRGILFPSEGSEVPDARSWERAIDAALDRAVGELGDAVQG